jgi:hypothetical protein
MLLAALIGVGMLAGSLITAGQSEAATIYGSGNTNGNFPVPYWGQAVNTSNPNHVIGDGWPASCTSSAVVQAVAEGGIITFNCGPNPVTIFMNETANVDKTEHSVVLDGGGLVTLSGEGQRRILFSDTCLGVWSTNDCINQPYPRIAVQNITFEDGYDGAHQATCKFDSPECWFGGVDGGGAIYAEGGEFKAVNSSFLNNQCYSFGADLGGGAIRVLGQYLNRPVYITNDTFTGNSCANGGALSSINVNWDVLNSVFTDNAAIGWGANQPVWGTPGGGSGGALYSDNTTNYSTLIGGTVMDGNTAAEGGGAILYVVAYGPGNLTLNQSQLWDNASDQFWTYPGIFVESNDVDGQPVMINSTDTYNTTKG